MNMKFYIGIGASAVIISLGCFGCGSDQSSQTTSPTVKVVQVPATRSKPTVKPTPTIKPTPAPTPTRAERRRMKTEAKKKAKEERRQKEAAEAEAVALAKKHLSEMMESNNSSDSSGETGSDGSSPGGEFADAADRAAIADLQTNSWVKDLYVSPGHMNIGVIRDEKDWSAPMISLYACGVLRKHGSKLNRVRFVDIEAVANQGQSPGQAEIYTSACP